MHYIGIDAHKDNLVIQHMDEDGDLGITEEISATKEDILQFLDSLDFEASITLEAGKNYWWLHNLFSEHSKVLRVNVVDARRSRNLSKELSSMSGYGRAKNDRIDAEMMAEQDRRGLAPKIIVPTIQELEIRTLCRHRMDLVVQRTRIVNKTHAILSMHGISINFSELIDNIDSQQKTLSQLPGFVQIVVKSYLELFVCIRNEIQEFEKILQDKLPSSDPQIRLIQTAPGFGEILARVVHTEIRDICRFKCHGSLINYSGLAPIEDESNGKKGLIKLNRFCNYYLKYAFIEAAHHARMHPKYRRKYELDLKKHGKIRAKLNLARRLAKAIYWMLIRQQPFHN